MITRRIFLVGAAALAAPATVQAAQAAPSLREILFDPELPVLGNPNGDVSIAEFFDYMCPSCKALHPHLKRLVAEDGGIRLIMKDWPINGDLAQYASRMTLASVHMGVYAKTHAALMALQGGLSAKRIDDAMRAQGVDVGKVRDMLDIHLGPIDALLARNRAQARALKLPGTPGFIVGNRLFRRVIGLEELTTVVARVRNSDRSSG